ncbi:MAG: rsbV [Chlamydiia bacterium]|nr:rsbV [Chlamydiia bacterium]
MQLKTEKRDSVVIIYISGRVDAVVADDLQALLTTQILQKNCNILIDCREVNYLSSAGMRVFLHVIQDVGSAGGSVAFCNFCPMVREVIQLTGVEKYFNHFESVDEALKIF